jgi:hypothetical protein
MRAPLRPTFELTVAEPAELLLERAARRLQTRGCSLCGIVTSERIELHVPPARQHLWSPALRIDVRPEADASRLRGIYGPHPHVWMLFAGAYGVLAFGVFVALTFVLAQWTLGQRVSALYALGVLLLLAVGMRFLALLGQGLGTEQMDELRAFLDDVIAEGAAPDSVPRHSGVRASPAGAAAGATSPAAKARGRSGPTA